MPDPKERSAFLPIMLLVVGLVVIAGVVLAFVLTVDCEACEGLGTLDYDAWGGRRWSEPQIVWACYWCQGKGSITLYRMLIENPDDELGPFRIPTKDGNPSP